MVQKLYKDISKQILDLISSFAKGDIVGQTYAKLPESIEYLLSGYLCKDPASLIKSNKFVKHHNAAKALINLINKTHLNHDNQKTTLFGFLGTNNLVEMFAMDFSAVLKVDILKKICLHMNMCHFLAYLP